jgi:glyoxylase-like metal-dependent hydrolase (beta-lactamase superfamily II)
MPRPICCACGTQYPDAGGPPAACPVCDDERQYVPVSGQAWTTLEELREGHANRLEDDGGYLGIDTQPKVGIGQRAVLVPYAGSNLLWDCVSLLDDATAEAIDARGGLAAIAISHPHYYTTMLEWAARFDCPVHLHAADRAWVMRDGPGLSFWDGETLDLGHGLTLVRGGGHFPGGAMLHDAGTRTLLTGDIIQVVPDRRHVGFMWSYPNLVPLPDAAVQAIRAAVEPFDFDAIVGAFRGWVIPSGAKDAVRRSAERYPRALRGELG